MSNLLVIDFDFFFPNPAESGETGSIQYQLYDWSHSESPLHIDSNIIWPDRASTFWANDMELPQVETAVLADFWNRFDIAPDAEVCFADSNAYAGTLLGPNDTPFDHVWLFDAHHDLFRIKTPKQLIEFVEGNRITCEDWMFVHLVRDSELHWRYPRWLSTGPQIAAELPTWIDLDSAFDDGEDLTDVQFDTVFVCRSGAWVPPWCDEHFVEFMRLAPGKPQQLDDAVMVREWEEAARIMHKTWSQFRDGYPALVAGRG